MHATAAGVRRYVFLSKRLEIVTFEIKPAESISIMAVLEAIAHREACHRAYVIYATSRAKFEIASESDRKYDQGLFRVGDTWLYVNRGIGAIGLPARCNCRPEITVITLTTAVP